jgi:hypothetical protein
MVKKIILHALDQRELDQFIQHAERVLRDKKIVCIMDKIQNRDIMKS